jgi:hypothetical protein
MDYSCPNCKEASTHESLLKNKGSLYAHFWNLQIKLE